MTDMSTLIVYHFFSSLARVICSGVMGEMGVRGVSGLRGVRHDFLPADTGAPAATT